MGMSHEYRSIPVQKCLCWDEIAMRSQKRQERPEKSDRRPLEPLDRMLKAGSLPMTATRVEQKVICGAAIVGDDTSTDTPCC